MFLQHIACYNLHTITNKKYFFVSQVIILFVWFIILYFLFVILDLKYLNCISFEQVSWRLDLHNATPFLFINSFPKVTKIDGLTSQLVLQWPMELIWLKMVMKEMATYNITFVWSIWCHYTFHVYHKSTAEKLIKNNS